MRMAGEFHIMVESSQITITQSFNKQTKYVFNNPKQKKLVCNIAFIVNDL